MRTDHLLAIGTAAGLPCDDVLAVDPRHPCANPGFQLRVTVDGDVIARGMSLMSSDQVAVCMGKRSADLPENVPTMLVHRDDLVVLA